jgi:hypothetical protein
MRKYKDIYNSCVDYLMSLVAAGSLPARAFALVMAALFGSVGSACDADSVRNQAQIERTPVMTGTEGEEIVTRVSYKVQVGDHRVHDIDGEVRQRITKGQEELSVTLSNRTALETVHVKLNEEASALTLSAGGHTLTAKAAPIGLDDQVEVEGVEGLLDAQQTAAHVVSMPIGAAISTETWLAMGDALEMDAEPSLPTAKWGKLVSAFRWVWHNVIGFIVNHVKV